MLGKPIQAFSGRAFPAEPGAEETLRGRLREAPNSPWAHIQGLRVKRLARRETPLAETLAKGGFFKKRRPKGAAPFGLWKPFECRLTWPWL